MEDHYGLYFVRIALELAYQGGAYNGWQSQKNAISIQGVLEERLSRVLREPVKLMGCGRTDTGVHARYFVAHTDLEHLPDDAFLFKINQSLPPDIVIHDFHVVKDKFHARFSPTSRKYEYHIHQEKNPFLQGLSYFRYGEFDLDAIQEACDYLMTLTDFKTFSRVKTTVKTFNCRLDECRWEHIPEEKRLIFHVRADRFLRNMVRAMVGTFILIGTGEMSLEELKEAMASGDRRKAGRSVPAHGLYLTEVVYNWDEFIDERENEAKGG